MDIDTAKVDRAVLALLYLTLHDGNRAWKNLDFDTMNRLREQGFISDPVSRAKSVVLTEKGLSKSEELAKACLGKSRTGPSGECRVVKRAGRSFPRPPSVTRPCKGRKGGAASVTTCVGEKGGPAPDSIMPL